MRTIQGVRAGWLLAVLGACVLGVGAAGAAVGPASSERPGSILIFPKVVRDGSRDTIIQITNSGNSTNNVRCFYIDGRPGFGKLPRCSETDFDLALTKQQPTHWAASTGRRVDPSDIFGSAGAGLDPGLVPPLSVGFEGALVCVEVADTGEPLGQNKLRGEATITSPGVAPGVDEAKYNAIAIRADSPNGPLLDLNGNEYGQCPTVLQADFIPDGGLDPAIEAIQAAQVSPLPHSRVDTQLTFVPCTLDLDNGVFRTTQLTVNRWDEFEIRLSGANISLTCWGSLFFGEEAALRSTLEPGGTIATEFATVRLEVAAGGSPVVGVQTSYFSDKAGNFTSASVNLHTLASGNATITIPQTIVQ